MYRELVQLLLSFTIITAAPQQNSNITYITKQLGANDTPLEPKHSFRESRIEILPITIPGNFDLSEATKILNETVTKQREDLKNVPQLYNYSDRIYSIKSNPKNNNNTEKIIATEKPVNISKEVVSDILPSESKNTNVLANKEISTIDYETDATVNEVVTKTYVDEPTVIAEVVEETTKTPRLPPKLSHYGKSNKGSFSQNLIKNSGKRKFRSRCRCEKIWNCSKLQITVPRCPDEYFLCCA